MVYDKVERCEHLSCGYIVTPIVSVLFMHSTYELLWQTAWLSELV